MNDPIILFILFTSFLALGCVYLLLGRDLIYAAYALALVLISVSALYVLASASYLAVVQLFIYAGGVVVLLIFGIMASVRKRGQRPVTSHRLRGATYPLIAALFFLLLSILVHWPVREFAPNSTHPVRLLGIRFFTDQLLAFELMAYLLLVALVAAVYLAKKSLTHD